MLRPYREKPKWEKRLCFFFDRHLDLRRHVAEYLDGHRKFADGLERFAKLRLALVDLEALRRQSFRDVRGGDRAEHLIVLPGLAREFQRNAVEQRGLLLRGLQLRRRFLGQRRANPLDGLQVARRRFDRQLLRQKKIACIARLHGNHVAAVAQLFNVFLKNDLHVFSLSSCFFTPEGGLRLRRFGSWRWCHRRWRRRHRSRCRCCMRGRGMSRRRSRHDHARRLRARRAARKRQQRDIARPLDGHAQPPLMPRANARHPPRQNLPALLHELRQDVRALVVDEVHLLDAELAHLFLAKILALASWPASGAARTPATRSAFASRTTVPAARTAVTTMTAGAAFTPRSSSGRWCLFLFLCHNFHPFNRRPDRIGTNLLVTPAKPE